MTQKACQYFAWINDTKQNLHIEMHIFACKKTGMNELQWKTALYKLRSRILSGELAGGAKLRASHLAADMDISRTPISEALIKLEGEGLLIRDKSGFTVRSFGVAEVYDTVELRGLLEGAAAQKAAEIGASTEDLAKVKRNLADMEDVIGRGDVKDYDQINLEFHNHIVAMSQSQVLIDEVERSYRLPFAGPSAFPTRRDDVDRFRATLWIAQDHHRQIVTAIERRESMRAFGLMREHARLALQNVSDAFQAPKSSPQLALVRDAK